jgi:hypothetical protein
MNSNTFTAQMDCVVFTHKLIDRGIHNTPAYAALIAAFTAAQNNQIDAGFAALKPLGLPTGNLTLIQTIDKIVSEWS